MVKTMIVSMMKTGYKIENCEVPHYQPRHHRGRRKLSVWQHSAPPGTTEPAPWFQGKWGINTTDLRDIPNAGIK